MGSKRLPPICLSAQTPPVNGKPDTFSLCRLVPGGRRERGPGLLDLPEGNGAITAGGGGEGARGVPGDVGDPPAVLAGLAQGDPGGRVKEPDGLIAAAGQHQPAVGGESRAGDTRGVALEGADLAAAGQVPEMDDAVHASGQGEPAV